MGFSVVALPLYGVPRDSSSARYHREDPLTAFATVCYGGFVGGCSWRGASIRYIPDYVLERIGPHGTLLLWATFVVVSIALFVGVYWHMRRKMGGAGRVAEAPTRLDPKPRGGGGTGPAARGRWIYKTDEEGRPRRFLSHREAAWWAALRTGTVAGPIVLYAFLGAFLETAGPGMPLTERFAYFSLPAAVFLVWLAVVGTVYLYLVLSGGVMAPDERRRRGNEGDGERA